MITVENIGNITVSGLSYVETFTDGSGNGIKLTTNPTFISSTQSSTIGVLKSGEIATYTANYVIGQSAADSGSIINSILFHCYATNRDGADGARYIMLRKKEKVFYD